MNPFSRNRIITVVAVALLFASCAKENDDINADDRDQFTGTWSCNETENSSPPVTIKFPITISKKGSADTLTISNFNNIGASFQAIFLVSGTSIAVPAQDVSAFHVSGGSGLLSSGKISITYTVDNVNYSAECTR